MGFFDSKSSSSVTTNTSNVDDRLAIGESGLVLQAEGAGSNITFEDVSSEALIAGFDLARDVITQTSTSFGNALSKTQGFVQNIQEENNSPSSDNMRNITIAGLLVAGVSIVAIAFNKGKK